MANKQIRYGQSNVGTEKFLHPVQLIGSQAINWLIFIERKAKRELISYVTVSVS